MSEFKCSICGYQSSTKDCIQRHFLREEKNCGKDAIIIKVPVDIICNFCNKKFTTKPILLKHLKKNCKEKKEKKEKEMQNINTEIQNTEIQNFIKLQQNFQQDIQKDIVNLQQNLQQNIQQTIKQTIKQAIHVKNIQQEKILIKNFDKKPVVYLGLIDKYTVKFGYTNDIERRTKENKDNISSDFTLEFCIESLYNREIEKDIKNLKSTDLFELINDNLSDKIFSKKYKNKTQTELIRLEDEFTLEVLIDKIIKIKNSINKDEVIKQLNIRLNEAYNIIKMTNI